MTILLVSSEFPPGPGGIGQHSFSLAKALAAHGRVVVLANQDYCEEDERMAWQNTLPDSVEFVRFKSRESRWAPLARIWQAIKLTACEKPQSVYVTGRFPLWIGALLRWRFLKLAVYGFAHGTEVTRSGGWQAKLTRFACGQLSGTFPVSAFTAGQLHGVPRLRIVPNGLDKEFIAQAKHVLEGFAWQGSPKLLTVGNLTPRKGQHRVITALPTLLKLLPTAHYHMVGLPTTKEHLQQLAQKLGVAQSITFHGRLPGKADLMRAYASADIFIMLSENQLNGDVEGFGIAILEANALGLPAIGAKGCGIEDAISTESGILVDGDNPEEILLAVKTILANYDTYSKGARAWAEKHNWEELVKALGVVSFES